MAVVAQCVRVVPEQSASVAHPQVPVVVSHAVPSAFVVQSVADAHSTQVFAALHTLAVPFTQAVVAVAVVHSTHVLVVGSQTRLNPVVHCALDVHDATQVFVVMSQT